MATFTGTSGNDSLLGTEVADTIEALAGNDTVNAGTGNDTIFGGQGTDRLFGELGDDTFVEDQVIQGAELFDGGDGFDTIELRPVPIPFRFTLGVGTLSQHNFNPATLVSIERVVFASTPTEFILGTFTLAQASGISEFVGGGGRDILSLQLPGSGNFTVPTLHLTNFTSAPVNAWVGAIDFVVVGPTNGTTNNPAITTTVTAASDLDVLQVLQGGAGADTLIGSARADTLNGFGGVNMLFGGEGNDSLSIINSAPSNGTGGFLAPTNFTGLGSTFDGGGGTDVLSVGGYVSFQGTLIGIEGVDLLPAFTPTGNFIARQDAAFLDIDLGHLSMLPTNAFFRGVGTVHVDVDQGQTFDFSQYTFEAGSNVAFEFVAREGQVPGAASTWVGTSNGDRFLLGDHTVTVTGGGGADSFVPEGGNATILDFTPGVDKLDFSGTGITGVQRLSDFIVSTGPNFTIRGESGGQITQFTLQGVTQAQLDFGRDFIFNPGGQQSIEFGGATNDLLFGFNLNDELHGGDGDDRIYGGGGVDRLFGDGGNDTIILDGQVGVSGPGGLVARYDGGTGIDTLELRPAGINFVTAGAAQTSYGLAGAEFVGIERIVFASTASNGILVSLLAPTIAANGPIELVGGAGIDSFVTVAFSSTGGDFTMPAFTLTNWTTLAQPYRQPGSDFLVLFASGAGNFTLNARNGLNATQAMFGQAGNDTLNGSDGTDILNGNGGANQLFGNGGNDVLVIANTVVQNGSNFVTTTFNGAGSTFDGGTGFDVLSVGGVVNFAGSLAGIEGIFLQRAFASPNPGGGGSQAAAHLTLYASQLASLPGNLSLDGTGTVQVVVNGSENFDGSAYRFEAGSNVTVVIDYENDVAGFMGTTTLIGTSGKDVFDFGEGTIIATGGAGADTFEIGEGTTTITDFTPGEDKLSFLDSGITSLQRLADFIVQSGPDLVIQGTSGGETTTLILQGVSLGNLDFARDVIFAQNTGPAFQEDQTEFDDLIFGFAGNDVLRGLGGNDRIYGGGGIDQLFGGDGNDTIILDGAVTLSPTLGTVLDGGTGFDTLVLRNTAGIPTALGSPLTVYQITPPSTITGIEALRFESQVGTQIQFIALQNVIVGSGLTAITGGAGRDFMVEVVFGGGEFTVSNYQLTNWTLDISDPNSDVVTLVASSFPVNGQIVGYTLNAREGLATTQSLLGAAGNDTLNGSSGSEFLDGRGGVNVLRGNGGRDGLIVANVTPFGGSPTNLTYAGSLFDGGDGIDSLLVSGVVDFQGTLQNIERIFFNPAFTATGPGQVGQAPAHLLLSGANLAALPRDLVLFGNGTLSIDLDPGQVYDASGYVVLPGFTVAVNVTGSSINDTITLGALAETVDDDGGIDTVVFGGTRASYAFGVGANGEVLIGDDVFTRIELFQFSDGLFGFDGFQLVPATTSGSVADGYIAGATVWIDVDGDGVLDPDEPFAISDAAGRFTIASTATGALRASGGTNIDTGLANTLLLSAPDGAGVINPLTTLIENLIADGASAAEAEAAVETALGLDPDLDLTQLDLIAAAATDPAALEAQKAAATIAEVIGAVVENGGDQADALAALAGLIDDAGDVGGTVDLTATDTLTIVIGAGLPGEDVADLVEDAQAVAEAIDAAEDLDDITEVQGNTAPTAADDLAALDEDATVTGNVIVGSDSDPDAGQMLSVTAVNGAALTGQPIHGTYGTLIIAADGSYSYTADADVVDAFAPGTHLTESFAYAIGDGTGGIASATLSFDITTIDDNRTLTGGNGADTLSGTGRDDILFGGRGDDVLAGSGGADRLYGGQGADRLSGGDGFDLLVGGQGGDILRGDGGNDVLIGGKGGDVLTGGGGADVFDFSRLDGTDRDVITDFEVGVDSIHLGAGLTVTGTSQSGASTVLALSNGGSIVLQGVHADSLDGLFSADLPDWTAGLPLI